MIANKKHFEKTSKIIEHTLTRSLTPTLIADYQTKLPDKTLLHAKWQDILDNLEE